MAKKISIILVAALTVAVMYHLNDAFACNYECVIVCNDISSACLGANPYTMNENPWGYADHVNMCENNHNLCMEQAFPEVA